MSALISTVKRGSPARPLRCQEPSEARVNPGGGGMEGETRSVRGPRKEPRCRDALPLPVFSDREFTRAGEKETSSFPLYSL